MSRSMRFRRGILAALKAAIFEHGEPGYAVDTKKLYIADGGGKLIPVGDSDMRYNMCASAMSNAVKKFNIPSFNLVMGAPAMVRFAYSNIAEGVHFDINGTGPHPVYYRNAPIPPAALAAGHTYIFVFNGTHYEFVGDINTVAVYEAMTIDEAQEGTATKGRVIPPSVLHELLSGKADSKHGHDADDVVQNSDSRLVSDSQIESWGNKAEAAHMHDAADIAQDPSSRLVTDTQIGLWGTVTGKAESVHGHDPSDIAQNADSRLVADSQIAEWGTVSLREEKANKGIAGGYASLDEEGKVPLTQISDAVLGQMTHAGEFNAATAAATLTSAGMAFLGITQAAITLTNNTAAVTGFAANQGNFYITEAAGTFAGIPFLVGDWLVANQSGWAKISNTDAVTGVKGSAEAAFRIGNVNITPGNIGLGNVQNIAQAPATHVAARGTAQHSLAGGTDALAGFSQANFLQAEKEKLGGIANNANNFGQADVRATPSTGLVNTDAAAPAEGASIIQNLGRIWRLINTHIGARGSAHTNAVAGGDAGFMAGADKTKLDGITAGANVNPALATQAEAEAGTSEAAGGWSPLRVWQAIRALARNGLATGLVNNDTAAPAAGATLVQNLSRLWNMTTQRVVFSTAQNNTDLNNMVTTGMYRLGAAAANRPAGSDHGQLIVSRGGDTVFQIVGAHNSGRAWFRGASGVTAAAGSGNWSPWREIASLASQQNIDGGTF